MTREALKALRDRLPFRPFALVMSNGNRFDLKHPDYLFVPPAPADHALYYDEHGVPVFLDLDSISEVDHDINRAKKDSPQP
jgi:hypothetical protein